MTYEEARRNPAQIRIFQKGCDKQRWGLIKYWSNCLGELHYHGKYDITEAELPGELKAAYNSAYGKSKLRSYLVETADGYGISCEMAFDSDYAKRFCVANSKVFESIVSQVLVGARNEALNGCAIYIFEETDIADEHEILFVFPADIDPSSLEKADVFMQQVEDEVLYALKHDWKRYYYPLKSLVCDEAGCREEAEFAQTLCDFGVDKELMEELGVGELAGYLE
ncbi:MAG: hypothetical protein IJW45_07865 [Oscillospiraceae bacterium]|nr:hypothetical protein [Oscillospiraceae bacterium]